MIYKTRFLLFVLLCWPMTSWAEDNLVNVDALAREISASPDIETATEKYKSAVQQLLAYYNGKVDEGTINSARAQLDKEIACANISDAEWRGSVCACTDTTKKLQDNECVERTDDGSDDDADENTETPKDETLEEKKAKYEEAKANEQSLANRTLTAASVAAAGIGGMELAMGLSEQKADKEADQNMSAYIETFRCTYGGNQVKASAEPIELPGGNDDKIMQYRSEYFALANDLKERKEALGMKPGIEAEEILDKSQMGLYDDENIGITGGAYESLYRAKMLGSEEDQAKINEMAEASSKRVKGGAIAAGAGVAVGIVGNSLINGKLGELIKNNKNCKETEKYYKTETNSLSKWKTCLKRAGATDTDELKFNNFQTNWLSLTGIRCKTLIQTTVTDKKAQNLFEDKNSTSDVQTIITKLVASFGADNVKTMLGASDNTDEKLQSALKTKMENTEQEVLSALRNDEDKGCDSSFINGLKDGLKDGLGDKLKNAAGTLTNGSLGQLTGGLTGLNTNSEALTSTGLGQLASGLTPQE